MTPTHKELELKTADKKVYRRAMQSLYATCMVKSKAAESGCLHVHAEEKCRVQLHKTFASVSSYITAAN